MTMLTSAKKAVSRAFILLLAAMFFVSPHAMAENLSVPHVNRIRVNKFHLQLVDKQYWFVQNGEWDWDVLPLSLQWEYSDGTTDSFLLPKAEAGSAHVLCDLNKLESLAQAKNDQAIKFSVVAHTDGQTVTLAADYPFLVSAHNSIALNFRLWYADGALWFAGGKAAQPPTQLLKTFSDGTTAALSLPATVENGSVRLLSPAQVERDLADASIGWVEYSLQ